MSKNPFSQAIIENQPKPRLDEIPYYFIGLKLFMENREEAEAMKDAIDALASEDNGLWRIQEISVVDNNVYVVQNDARESFNAFKLSYEEKGSYARFHNALFNYLLEQTELVSKKLSAEMARDMDPVSITHAMTMKLGLVTINAGRNGLPLKMVALDLNSTGESLSDDGDEFDEEFEFNEILDQIENRDFSAFYQDKLPGMDVINSAPYGYQMDQTRSYIFHDGILTQNNNFNNVAHLSHDLDEFSHEIGKVLLNGYVPNQLRDGLISFLSADWDTDGHAPEHIADTILHLAVNRSNRYDDVEDVGFTSTHTNALIEAINDRRNPGKDSYIYFDKYLDNKEYRLYRGNGHREINDNYEVIQSELKRLGAVSLKVDYLEGGDASAHFIKEGRRFPGYKKRLGLGFYETSDFMKALSPDGFKRSDSKNLSHLLNETMHLVKAMKYCAFNDTLQRAVIDRIHDYETMPIKEIAADVGRLVDSSLEKVDAAIGEMPMPESYAASKPRI